MRDPKASLDRTIRLKLRLIAVERHRDGEPVAQIAASLGVSPGMVYAWIRTCVSQAQSCLASSNGAVLGVAPPDAGFPHKKTLYGMLDCAAPRDYGFDTNLWSRFVVGSFLELNFGISLDKVTVDRLLGTLGFPVDACIRAISIPNWLVRGPGARLNACWNSRNLESGVPIFYSGMKAL